MTDLYLDALFQKTIKFGDSVQDVMSAVGAPNRIFYKSEDKMKIHSPNAHRKASQLKSDYFYNYFTFGMVSVVLCPIIGLHLNCLLLGPSLRCQTQQSQKIHSAYKLSWTL